MQDKRIASDTVDAVYGILGGDERVARAFVGALLNAKAGEGLRTEKV